MDTFHELVERALLEYRADEIRYTLSAVRNREAYPCGDIALIGLAVMLVNSDLVSEEFKHGIAGVEIEDLAYQVGVKWIKATMPSRPGDNRPGRGWEMDEKMRVILVGRHAPADLPENIEVVGQENITWPTNLEATERQLEELVKRAAETDAAILLQNVPGPLAVALVRFALANEKYLGDPFSGSCIENHGRTPVRVGVIVSIPGPREAGVLYETPYEEGMLGLIEAVNPNARVEFIDRSDGPSMRVTVDPPTKFKFSHIEWLNL